MYERTVRRKKHRLPRVATEGMPPIRRPFENAPHLPMRSTLEVHAVPYKSMGISKSAPGLRNDQDGALRSSIDGVCLRFIVARIKFMQFSI